MKLKELGFTEKQEAYQKAHFNNDFEIGRVISEHKERYTVKTEKGDLEAEITGNMRFTAKTRTDFPAVGDWVALLAYEADSGIIHAVFPRTSMISRQEVGSKGEIQIIATNIDCAFIVQAVDRDFNINRMERYLTICHTSKVEPVIVLTKTDLIDGVQVDKLINETKNRIKNSPVITISNVTGTGIKQLDEFIQKGKTYCLLGSSGVGKSSLINMLSGNAHMKTDAISESTNKGRHVTTHRELIVLANGAIIIDNPGMREVGITDSTQGLASTFDTVTQFATDCRFTDCSHTNEKGCAVIAAVENGEIDKKSYENYLKMEREKEHFESTLVEKRKKDKDFGKMVKSFKKDMKKLK